ncbi:MAG: S46 family peptidase [Bacteroidota bacterium]
MRTILTAVLILLSAQMLVADEGMWMLTQLDKLDLEEKGLELKLEEIYHPDNVSITSAIVWLGGCSASFVSPDGLILTNHHCAYGGLQRASADAGKDYIKNGFLAPSREKELPAPAVTAYVLSSMTDVTEAVVAAGEGVDDPVKRDRKTKEKIASITKTLEGDREDVTVKIAAFYKGRKYMQFIFTRYDDVRIVYAPPDAIGKYGGDIDNWMWPRHTGDFTFMRVYSAPDGSGAKYNSQNVPVKPENYLRIARNHLKEDDFTYIIGFPGGTVRWRTSESADWNLKHGYPDRVKRYSEILDLIEKITKGDSEGAIKAASLKASLANSMKNSQGQIDGMIRKGLVQEKRELEKDLMKWLAGKPDLKDKYGDFMKEAEEQYALLTQYKAKDDAMGLLLYTLSGTLPRIAVEAYDVARDREKPASERDPGFSEKKVKRTVERLKYRYLSYYKPLDEALFLRTLKVMAALPEGSRIKGMESILENPEKFVRNAYKDPELADVEYAKSLFNKSVAELEALEDPFVSMVAGIYEELEVRSDRHKAVRANTADIRKRYLSALYDWKGLGLYPDANGTIRLTYGPVRGYAPADAVSYEPFTTLGGVIQKNTGIEPFDMPEKLAKLHESRDFGQWADPELDDVPVAFTHMCDITGGNSGSAVMNGKGELIGLAFDGNYEAMTGDWQYDPTIQRSISVDIRYVMFVTEKFAGAVHILKEMGIEPSTPSSKPLGAE